ncbi:MAG: PTS fructose transporter subunit IIB [Chloroflexi bacterium]|jgi:fructose-specific phosphotransferase system IIB component|nr:PTS fructose transporter subunit IIB [Chloroflexota bacterium]
MKVVVVTSCAGGIAHTYMAAEGLTKAAKKAGDQIRIEIQGSLGIEDRLSQKEIDSADLVIWANDIAVINPDRFANKTVIKVNPHEAITNPNEVLAKAKSDAGLSQ